MEIKQNTLYLTTPNSYVTRDHLNLKIEIERELKLAVPIHRNKAKVTLMTFEG
jgi:hypothetical protein